MKKKNIVIVSVIVLLVGLGIFLNWFIPHQKAVNDFNGAVSLVEKENAKLQRAIDTANKLIKSENEPLEKKTLDNLKIAVTKAEKEMVEIPKRPGKTADIIQATKRLQEPVELSEQVDALNEKSELFKKSTRQMKQLTNPSELFVVRRLQQVASIVDIKAASEDNDPNSNLGKEGSYTAHIYFSVAEVSGVSGNDPIAKKTEGGGSIEVYATKEDAQKRIDYLAGFDGTMLASGSHNQYGTIIIRTSSKLTTSQQKALEKEILNELILLK